MFMTKLVCTALRNYSYKSINTKPLSKLERLENEICKKDKEIIHLREKIKSIYSDIYHLQFKLKLHNK